MKKEIAVTKTAKKKKKKKIMLFVLRKGRSKYAEQNKP